jgi:hypothetical protein
MARIPQRLPPTPSTIKRLFAYSGNQCAMPDCIEVLVDPSGTMLGKIAHICAAEPGGARHEAAMTDEQRRAEENLFIVCAKHHDIIDDKKNEVNWPAEKLRAFKKTHESRFKKAERQLLKAFVDTTQSVQPRYPKTLRAIAAALDEDMENNKEELKGIRQFINRIKELPLEERDFALKLAMRMKRRKKSRLPTDDVEGAFRIDQHELKRRMDLLEHHHLGSVDEAEEPRKYEVSLWHRHHGENPWIEILDFCEATNNDPSELVHDLNFGLYDG